MFGISKYTKYLYYNIWKVKNILFWILNPIVEGDARDPVQLQLSLKVCRRDLTTAQEELTRMKAEYWDVVPRRNWDALEQTHQQNLSKVTHKDTHFTIHTHYTPAWAQNAWFQMFSPCSCFLCVQMQTLQSDFDQLKREHDILLELHKEGSMQNKTNEPSTQQVLYSRSHM